MIYESRSTYHEAPNLEDYKNPHGGYNRNAYDADKIRSEIDNQGSYGVWKDEETGEILFSESTTFEPGPYYYDDGQGDFTTTYEAHFKLRPGQTAEEAFREREAIDRAKKEKAEKEAARKKALDELSEEGKKQLSTDIEKIQQSAAEELAEKIRKAENDALAAEEKRKLEEAQKKAAEEKRKKIESKKKEALEIIEKRKADPAWRALSVASKVLVAANKKQEARILIQSYLEQHTK